MAKIIKALEKKGIETWPIEERHEEFPIELNIAHIFLDILVYPPIVPQAGIF
ncbi:MAG: hypothetical protein H8E41_04315 [Desulfobulbaceae bacterium]|uniref:Uncharacterized protein n=1 Tax=Candidatus Desulfobia pelagia TaxID=2841692 RepID=A0A8J6TBP5_9BACT|nr:hypothetical protein [Candidatus Desulfobia pelagia]